MCSCYGEDTRYAGLRHILHRPGELRSCMVLYPCWPVLKMTKMLSVFIPGWQYGAELPTDFRIVMCERNACLYSLGHALLGSLLHHFNISIAKTAIMAVRTPQLLLCWLGCWEVVGVASCKRSEHLASGTIIWAQYIYLLHISAGNPMPQKTTQCFHSRHCSCSDVLLCWWRRESGKKGHLEAWRTSWTCFESLRAHLVHCCPV